MSWDVVLFNAPADAAGVADLTDDSEMPPLGPLADVVAKLQHAFDGLDLSDPVAGDSVYGDGWVIEVGILGDEDPVDVVSLRIVGHGAGAPDAVRHAARVLGCRALDCSTGEFIENGGDHAWTEFQAYHDKVYRLPRT